MRLIWMQITKIIKGFKKVMEIFGMKFCFLGEIMRNLLGQSLKVSIKDTTTNSLPQQVELVECVQCYTYHYDCYMYSFVLRIVNCNLVSYD